MAINILLNKLFSIRSFKNYEYVAGYDRQQATYSHMNV